MQNLFGVIYTSMSQSIDNVLMEPKNSAENSSSLSEDFA